MFPGAMTSTEYDDPSNSRQFKCPLRHEDCRMAPFEPMADRIKGEAKRDHPESQHADGKKSTTLASPARRELEKSSQRDRNRQNYGRREKNPDKLAKVEYHGYRPSISCNAFASARST